MFSYPLPLFVKKKKKEKSNTNHYCERADILDVEIVPC